MDKLDFFENMEPYEETNEAVKLLVELASVPEQKYKTIEKPGEIIKALPLSSDSLSASQEITESDSDEEIVTARVEEAVVKESSAIIPEPIEPFFAEDEAERFNASIPQLKLSSTSDDSSVEYTEAPEEISSVIHTLDSQQKYAKETVATDKASKEPKQISVEDFYSDKDKESAKFEEQMVIEHTLPKIDFNQYLKEEDDLGPSVPPELIKPSIESEDKILLKTEKAEVSPELSSKGADIGREEKVDAAVQSDASKFVLDLPMETAQNAQEDFYMIDQAEFQELKDTAEKYDVDINKSEMTPEGGKESVPDSFKDTDSYKISNFKEKSEISPALPDESFSSYTEITLPGEILADKAAEGIKTETESDIFVAADEDKAGIEFSGSEADAAPIQTDEDRKISSSSIIDDNEQMTYEAIKVEAQKETKYESEEQNLEEETVSALPSSKEISIDSVKEKEKDFLIESKTGLDAFSEDKGEQEWKEPSEDKTPSPGSMELDKLGLPDVSLESHISLEQKKIDFPPLEATGEKQTEQEYLAPPLLPLEESKIKKVFKDSDKFREAQLPPFEVRKEDQVVPGHVIPSDEEKTEKSAVEKKEILKSKEEPEDYNKILAEAQEEAEEFIKDRIKKKQKEAAATAMEETVHEESDSTPQGGQSFSDFLAKVKSQAGEQELKPKKSADSEIPSGLDDHPLRPALDTPHVPEDIARMLPIIKPDSADKSRMDLPMKSSATEIEDLKYKSVPLSVEEKEEPVKEPKLKSLFSRLKKKKDKEERIE
jgi:hypothetical protein